MEVDNDDNPVTASKNRNNRKKRSSRRSSILKIMSPVRTALGDLNPNNVKEGTRDAKSKRLSNRRVSFADTLSVREFLNDTDAHTLGLLNSPHGQPASTDGDEEIVAPTIQGLDSLLSAPIKTPAEQSTLPDAIVEQEERADCQPTELTMTMDFTQSHGAILTDLETDPPRHRLRSCSSESDTSIHHEIDVPNPTFYGPTYSCLMPASFNSSTATEPGDIAPRVDEMEQTRVFQNDDTTGFMELTNCYGGLMNSSTSQRIDTSSFLQSLNKPKKSNTDDFLRSLMTKSGKSILPPEHLPQLETVAPTAVNCNQKSNTADFLKRLATPSSGIGDSYTPQLEAGLDTYPNEPSVQDGVNNPNAKHRVDCNLQSTVSVNVNQLIQYRADVEVVIPNTGIDKENEAHSRLLAARRRSDQELTTVEVTRVFSSDDQADMDITECVQSNSLTAPSVATGESQSRTRQKLPEDQTRLFTAEDAGLMEITECVGTVVQTSISRGLSRNTEDQTVMFVDGGDADMDETAPLGQIHLSGSSAVAGIQHYKPSFHNKSLSIIQEAEDENISRCSSSVVNCTSTGDDNKEALNGTTHGALVNDFTVGVDFTANVGQLRPKYTSTPFQPMLQNSLCPKDSDDDKSNAVDVTMYDQFSVKKSENLLGKRLSTSIRHQDEVEHESMSGVESKVQALKMPRHSRDEQDELELTTSVTGLCVPDRFEKMTSTSETTTIFSSGEQTGRMELTSCVGGLLHEPAERSVRNNIPAGERTQVFGVSENTGRMDLTTCVGGLVPINGGSKTSEVETTTVFGVGEHTGRMDLTSCVGGLVPTIQGKTPMLKSSRTSAAETTTGDNTGRMDLTSCVGGLLPSLQGKTPMTGRSKNSEVETTTVFGVGENTGRMELTSCVGGLVPTIQGKTPMLKSSRTSAAETTTVFGIGDNTGRMDLTTCVGGLVPSLQGKTPMSGASKTSEVETTTVFGVGEHTGRMELTSCVGGFVPTIQGKTPTSGGSKTSEVETTTVFGVGEHTGRMELTSCVGGLLPTLQGKTPMSGRNKTSEVETTTVFGVGEHTGRMELTSCVGGFVPTIQGKTPMSGGSKTSEVETTTVFGVGDNTGMMDLTSCVGGLVPTFQGKTPMHNSSRVSDPERTTVFGLGENTGRMELTSCVGGFVPTSQAKISYRNETSLAETMTAFGANTGRMELTSCVEGVLHQQKESSFSVDVGINDYVPVISRIFSAGEETEKMELTSTVESHLQQSMIAEKERQEIQNRRSGDVASSHDQVPPVTDMGESIKEIKESNENTVKSTSPCLLKEDLQVSDVPDIGYSEVNSIDDKDRSAGTFTIKVEENADTFTISSDAEGCPQEMCLLEQVAGSKRKQENYSESQSKLIKTDFNETGFVQETESMKGILEELPPDEIDELDNLDLTAATFHDINVSKRPPNDCSPEVTSHKSNLSKSLLERTENLSFFNVTKSAMSETTVGEVLENFFANLTSLPSVTSIRRSVMPVIQGSEPNNLSSRLRASCIDTPKCQMYEWAVDYVSQNTDKMKKSVLELTEKLYEKEEMKDTMIVGSAEMKDFEKRVQKLHQVCKKEMKTSWKEWKTKRLTSILMSVTDRHDHLKKAVESVSESSSKIDKDMQQLEKYESDLDAAISELESFELPDAEQQQLLVEQHSKLSRLEAELDDMQKNQTALQKQNAQLVAEEEHVQGEKMELEEKRNAQENVDDVAVNLQVAYNKLKRLERLCEGVVKEWDDAGCAVAFLYDSLWMRIKYSGVDPNDLEERVLSSITFESYLEGSSAASAHLSHVMVQEAVDRHALLLRYPTTKTLPKMLDEVSYIVSHARCIESDIRHVQFWHPVEIDDKKVTVEFSNFRAFAKFYVTFELVPVSYSTTPVKFKFKNKIGDISENDVNIVLSGVNPGYSYFKRLVQAVDDFIEKRCPADDGDSS